MAERKATALCGTTTSSGARWSIRCASSIRAIQAQKSGHVRGRGDCAGGHADSRCATSSTGTAALAGFELQIAIWLWFTVGFANFAEAMAEGRGKAQADNLRKTRTETQATAAQGRQRDHGAGDLAAPR